MPLHPEIASVVERRGRAGGSGRLREENSGVASPPLGGRIAWAAIIFATLALLPGAAGKGKEDLELVLSFHNRFLELPGEAGRSSPSIPEVPRQTPGALWAHAATSPLWPRAALLSYSPGAGSLLGLPGGIEKTEQFRRFVAGEDTLNVSYAHCYGGHQFGYWAGQLGDGRAINLGEAVSPSGNTWELQLKGAGQTPYSRRGDGRAVLRSSIREYIASEFMHAAGVPTSRALSLVATSEPAVMRDQFYDGNMQKEPGAIVLRMAPTWVRFGTFEMLAASRAEATMASLADHVIGNHMPEIAGKGYAAFLSEVVVRSARMVAGWQSIGFVHGVMNTDNMSILGITIDYGPFGFMERFDPDFVPNTSDDEAMYSFSKQPSVVLWNLEALAKALSLIIKSPAASKDSLDRFWPEYRRRYRELMKGRIGLSQMRAQTLGSDGDAAGVDAGADNHIAALLSWMQSHKADWTNTLRGVYDLSMDRCGAADGSKATEKDVARLMSASGAERGGEGELRSWLSSHFAMVVGSCGDKNRRESVVVEEEMAEEGTRTRGGAGAAGGGEERGGGAGAAGAGEERGAGAGAAGGPVYVPRNHLLHRAIEASTKGDHSVLQELFDVMIRPNVASKDPYVHARFSESAPEWSMKRGINTLSCSS